MSSLGDGGADALGARVLRAYQGAQARAENGMATWLEPELVRLADEFLDRVPADGCCEDALALRWSRSLLTEIAFRRGTFADRVLSAADVADVLSSAQRHLMYFRILSDFYGSARGAPFETRLAIVKRLGGSWSDLVFSAGVLGLSSIELDAIAMKFAMGYSIRRAAHIADVAPGTMHSRVRLALRKLSVVLD